MSTCFHIDSQDVLLEQQVFQRFKNQIIPHQKAGMLEESDIHFITEHN